MTILVTGVGGFVGRRLLKKICAVYGKENVVALSSKTREECQTIVYRKNGKLDLSNVSKLSGVKKIIHLGAFIPKDRKDVNNIKECNSNIEFTQELLSYDFPKLTSVIYISTVDVYQSGEIVTEETHPNPISLYGYSKLYCEKIVESYCKDRAIDFQILRTIFFLIV